MRSFVLFALGLAVCLASSSSSSFLVGVSGDGALPGCKLGGLRLSSGVGLSPAYWDLEGDYTAAWPADIAYGTVIAYPSVDPTMQAAQRISLSINPGHSYYDINAAQESTSFAVPAGTTTELLFRVYGTNCETHYYITLTRPAGSTANGWYADTYGACSATCAGTSADRVQGTATRTVTCRAPSTEGPGQLQPDAQCAAATKPTTSDVCFHVCATGKDEGAPMDGSTTTTTTTTPTVSDDPYGCAKQTDCLACTNTHTCGWCGSACATGTEQGPTSGACASAWVWSAATCAGSTTTDPVTTPVTTDPTTTTDGSASSSTATTVGTTPATSTAGTDPTQGTTGNTASTTQMSLALGATLAVSAIVAMLV